ncbi:hypothetical protein EYM_05685 [Ignicoccus islandicus DSM 13165]|uniref:Proteasome assembly chaperone family protein n=1 Tax=Ignicoccus islandicus DSM 13165 TaxID=940295 RepID=A0A0U3EDT8_9CREN|nr:PAC2 family protein [Ignicoccus islandicus]ALU12611.1 hypothetical protein EYM_05685 [Ignicoccus islandicus DSM 13165]
MIIEVHENKRVKAKYLIVGFHDVGLVGIISTRHLIEELGLEQIGGIDIPDEMLVTTVKEGVSNYPIGIYHGGEVALIFPEIPLPPPSVFPLSQAIMDYAARIRCERIISLTGLANPNRLNVKPRPGWIVSQTDIEEMDKLREWGRPLKDGILYGPTAALLKSSMVRNPPTVALLADAFPEFPDPGAAAVVLQGLEKVYGIKVNVEKLLEDAEKIKARLQENVKRAMTVMKEAQPLTYA